MADIYATGGNDSLRRTAEEDPIFGLTGSETLFGGGGGGILFGAAAQDRLSGRGGLGRDKISGCSDGDGNADVTFRIDDMNSAGQLTATGLLFPR
ncbi:MAG: hypothetical protein GDA41_02935 [Rhodospirillales bacterium]|nr:hypothetical protein [Rhodospirillales bacterium]